MFKHTTLSTEYSLMFRFQSPTVALSEIAQEFFGITPRTAEQQAKAGALPVPTFKLRKSEKSPTLIRINELAAYIDEKADEAANTWAKVSGQDPVSNH